MRTIQGSNVCVVGGAGFLGSHLVEHLINDRQCNVLVVDNLITGRKEFLHPKTVFEWADITQSEHHLYQMFKHHKIEYVFNYAAMPYIPLSFERPLFVFDINALGALKVINAAQEAGVKGILQVSSAEIYGNAGGSEATGKHDNKNDSCPWNDPETYCNPALSGLSCTCLGRKISEDSEVNPHSTYGAAKAAIDALIQVRWKEAKTPCIALRQFNCIGERETHPYIVPEIISQLQERKDYYEGGEWPEPYSCSVHLGNNSFRDFQYARDAVRMAAELLEKGEFGQVYNMGSQEGIKMYDLAKLIGRLMGFANTEVVQDPKRVRPWEIWHLQSDNTKLYSVIDSRPTVNLEGALQRTINYFHSSGNTWGWE